MEIFSGFEQQKRRMKFDEVLEEIGEFGPYQKRVFFLTCLSAALSAFNTFMPVFTLGIPEHRCKVPGLPNDTFEVQNEAHARLINISIPPPAAGEHGEYSHCKTYSNFQNGSWNDSAANKIEKTACSSWVFDTTSFYPTAITEFEMVCGNEIMRSHSNMLGAVGALIGAFVLGPVSDIVGRKRCLFISLVMQLGSGTGIALAPNFITFAVFSFISGIARMGEFMIAYVIGVELVGPSKRTFAGIAMGLFWSFGLLILAGVGYFIRHWRYLQLALSLPAAFFFVYWWILPESPRWLLTQGRVDEAEKIIKKIAKSNGVELRKDLIREITLDDGPRAKITAMFTSPVLLLRCVIIFFNWLAISNIYYGLGLNVGNLSGNVYLNFIIATSMELCSGVMLIFIMEKMGRKKIYLVSLMIGGVACLATVFPVAFGNESHKWVVVTLSMVGKFGAAASFAIIYIFSAEIFPTVIRQSGIGACSIFEGVGGMTAPYIADLGIIIGGHFASVLPLIVFGAITIVASLMSLALPETLNKKLPETIKDAIEFGRSENTEKENKLLDTLSDDGATLRDSDKADDTSPTEDEILEQ